MTKQPPQRDQQPWMVLHLSGEKGDIAATGGKAARLIELHQRHYPVPHGFVVTVAAFQRYCEYNQIDANYDGDDRRLQVDKILNGSYPPELKHEIKQALLFYSFTTYAIRSSSIIEDGTTNSLAGQYHTYLNVTVNEVFTRIKACWTSMYSTAAAAYNERSLTVNAFQMGVIVQEQKNPQYAGVLFTMNPVSKDTDHLIIEWVEGLGDKLVSGEVTPSRIVVSRLTRQVTFHVGSALPPDFILRLVQLSLDIEQDYQFPIDLEWCIEQDEVIILQVRPITALQGKQNIIWTNVNMVENFPTVVTPFTWSIVDSFYQHYTRQMMKLFGWKVEELESLRTVVDCTTGIHAGRIYYNLSNWYESAYLLPIGPMLKTLLDNFIGQQVPFPFTPRTDIPSKFNKQNKIRRYLSFSYRFTKLWMSASSRVEQYETAFYERRSKWRADGYQQMSLHQLLQVLDDVMNGLVKHYYDRPAIVDLLAAVFPGGLKLLVKRWLKHTAINTDLAVVHLMQTEDIRSLEPSHLIEEQAILIRSHASWQRLLEENKWEELELQLHGEARKKFELFMEQFGGRCYHDCTIVSPTFEERHDLYWELVRKYQTASQQRASSSSNQSLTQETYSSVMDWTAHIQQSLTRSQRFAFRFLLHHTHQSIRLRERSRIIRSLLFGEIRQIAQQLGQRLVEKKHLTQADQIFYLQWNEIQDLAYGKYQFPETIPKLIALRQDAHRNNEDTEPPSLFVREQGIYYQDQPIRSTYQDEQYTRLVGIAVSGGTVTGRARIIFDPVNDSGLEPGDILVTRSTDPGWTPLFKIAAGLVVEKGGMLSHCAIVAREFGIPAIAAVERATSRIADGDILILHGDTGEIERVELADSEREII
ncbi:PEP-utilizing enzyme [Paenibacillus sp. SC116]|uniref:PEP/pyruvate-binding domain-containing protein n=1 Tax=Paenibacillus sp. SC116 TaxID=2968986 RepID=UPI00215AF9BC|nr:PEP/pyruvate-binding domain-containing protein [Paenibacillus sp. SC116]MCR8844554.1 PEP-utilizing enzyme [Paenibacillus sp. SC116]